MSDSKPKGTKYNWDDYFSLEKKRGFVHITFKDTGELVKKTKSATGAGVWISRWLKGKEHYDTLTEDKQEEFING